MMNPCASATRRSISRCSSRGVARSSGNWSRVCAPGARCGSPEHDRRTDRKAMSPRTSCSQQRPAEAADRAAPGHWEGRPDHRNGPLCDRHSRRDARAAQPCWCICRGWMAGARTAGEERPGARRLRRYRDERRADGIDDDSCPTSYARPSPGIAARSSPRTPSSRSTPARRCSSPTRTRPGSDRRTRTPTDCCASTSRKALTCHGGPPRTSKPSLSR